MVKYILFSDPIRQEEIENFYEACQLHRDYYRGRPKSYHPLVSFREPDYTFHCPLEMSIVYLGYPPYHVKYKQPAGLPSTTERTSVMPQLPNRSLGARYSRDTPKTYTR